MTGSLSNEDSRWAESLGVGGRRYRCLSIGNGILPFVFLLLMLMFPHSTFAFFTQQSPPEYAPMSPPVLIPQESTCKQTLMVHTFAWSYGIPFVGEYTPPNCKFNRVTFNFTVTSAGRQYDRLALMFFNDTEIFRTSTAEPTQNGIVWTYVKDMSNFLALFKEPQKIIFDLGNLVDDTYTGSWHTTLTATFFTAEDATLDPADVILPVSSRQATANGSSGFVVPDQKATNALKLPQNAKKAVFSISACGQAAEEFWWSNVLSSDTQVFGNDSTLYGYSPFRELQLLIDGKLAGVAWPFPVIFTGGIVPGFWRPVVGIDAFDLKEDEIDITAFLPLLSDGQAHNFEIRVAGIDDDGKGKGTLTDTVGSNWVVTGKVFLWLDSGNTITTGTIPELVSAGPSLTISSTTKKSANGTIKWLKYSVNVARRLSIKSTIKTSSGSQDVVWEQELKYSNSGQFTNGGNDQITNQVTSGVHESSNKYSKSFEYPLWVYSTYATLPGGNFTINGEMKRGKEIRTIGALAFPSSSDTFDYDRLPSQHKPSFAGASSSDWQNGTASYLAAPAQKKSYGSGTTEQTYSLSGIGDAVSIIQDHHYDISGREGTELYYRHVLATNNSIVEDEERFGSLVVKNSHPSRVTDKPTFAKLGIKAILGRGPF